MKATTERREAKAGRKSAIERQEQLATKKRKILNQSEERIADLDFTSSPSTSNSENEENSEPMELDEPCASGEQSEIDTASLASRYCACVSYDSIQLSLNQSEAS